MLHTLAPLFLALAAPSDLTGVYEVSGAPAEARLVLHERAGGELIGYLAGSPMTWIESAQRYPGGALLELMGADVGSEEPWTATLRLRVNGRVLEGVLIQEDEVIPLTLSRTTDRFMEESWIWYDTGAEALQEVSRMLDLGGSFIGGGFNSSVSCDFMACGGAIDSWAEVSGSHDIWTSSSGSCGQTGHLVGTFDSSTSQVDGTWDSTTCSGSTFSGIFLAGKAGAVYDKHLQALLLSIGAFADDFEAESVDGAGVPLAAGVFHSTYLSDGYDRDDWEDQLTAWYADYDQIEVEISGPTEVVTIIGPDVHPYLLCGPRVEWSVRATGVSVATGALEAFWEREEPDLSEPDLCFLDVEDGRVVFMGNGESQPLSIGLPMDPDDLSTTENPAWPFGVHGGGHAHDGHPGIDFTFADGSAEVIPVAAGVITEIRDNENFDNQVDILQEIRTGVVVQYGHISDPPLVSVGDVLSPDDPTHVIGNPGNTSDPSDPPHYIVHFALSACGIDDICPVPWFNTEASADWDDIWAQSHYTEELTEPFQCNERGAGPPYTATWTLETAGTASGPESICFCRDDGEQDYYEYTFFDASGEAYEAGLTAWINPSPSTIGIEFIPDLPGASTYAAADIIDGEMVFKLDATMPTDMSGAATYIYDDSEPPLMYTKLYVSNLLEGSVSIIDLCSGTVTNTISVGSYPAHLAYSPTLNEVYVGDLGVSEINTISTTTETVTASLTIASTAGAVGIDTSTGKVFALDTSMSGPGKYIHVMDTSSGTLDEEVKIGTNLQDILVDSANQLVYATDFAEGLIFFDTGTNTKSGTFALTGEAHGLDLDPDAGLLYVTRVGDDKVSVIDTTTDPYQEVSGSPVTVGSSPQWIALTTDKSKAYVTNESDGTVSVIDTTDLTSTPGEIDVEDEPFFVIVHPHLNRAYVTNRGSDSVSVINTSTDAVVDTVSVGSMPVGMALVR